MKFHPVLRFFAIILLLLNSIAFAENAATLERMANDAFDRMNLRRTQIGLSPLKRSAILDRSATAHARYITHNHSLGSEGHNENSKRPGFTGITPTQRMVAAGYSGNSTSENIALTSYPEGSLSTDDLIDAPYHRQSQFGAYLEAGVAMSAQPAPSNSVNAEQYIYVINFGANTSPRGKNQRTQPFVYPADGQQDVPADWIANESPNPVPDMIGQRVGYPISFSADPSDSLIINSFNLRDANDSRIAGRLITTDTQNGKPLDDYAFWIPLLPLAYGTSFQAHLEGTLNGTAFNKDWHFTTFKSTPLRLIPAAAQIRGEAVQP